MALLEDNTKKPMRSGLRQSERPPVNIYAPGTATAKAQKNFPSVGEVATRTFNTAANMAEKYAGGAGLRQMVSPIVNAREKQRQFFRNREINAMPDAKSTPENPHGKVSNVGEFVRPTITAGATGRKGTAMAASVPTSLRSNDNGQLMETSNHSPENIRQRIMPVTSPVPTQKAGTQQMSHGSGWIRNESTGESVSMGPGGQIRRLGPDGRPINALTKKITTRDSSTGQGDGGQRKLSRGNLDIQFDGSVDQAAQQRFLADPVRPTAQINRFDAQRGNGANIGQIASNNADRVLNGSGRGQDEPINTFGDVMRVKRGMALDKQNEIVRNNIANSDIDYQKSENILDLGNDRNSIDAMNIAGQNAERLAQIEGSRFALTRAQQLAQLQDTYATEKDPAKRKMLERQLYALSGKTQPKQQIITNDIFDEYGNKTGQEFLTPNDEGQLVPVQQGGGGQAGAGAPKSALDDLAKNPGLADQFKHKYGYLPQGT